jgi:hypothetical protein
MPTWRVLYTKQLTKKRKTYTDGFVVVRASGATALLNENGSELAVASGPLPAGDDWASCEGVALFDGFLVNGDAECGAHEVPGLGGPDAAAAACAAAAQAPLAAPVAPVPQRAAGSLLLRKAPGRTGFRPPGSLAAVDGGGGGSSGGGFGRIGHAPPLQQQQQAMQQQAAPLVHAGWGALGHQAPPHAAAPRPCGGLRAGAPRVACKGRASMGAHPPHAHAVKDLHACNPSHNMAKPTCLYPRADADILSMLSGGSLAAGGNSAAGGGLISTGGKMGGGGWLDGNGGTSSSGGPSPVAGALPAATAPSSGAGVNGRPRGFAGLVSHGWLAGCWSEF